MVEQGDWLMAVFVYTLGTIGFSGANVFYDSLLPSLANEESVDSVSSLGFAMGYLGGGLLFLLNVIMTLNPSWFGLADAAEAVRWSFVTVSLWWGVFTLITLFWVPEPRLARDHVSGNSMAEGLAQLGQTFKELRHLKTVMLFLFAYWFYMDGVDTIVRMAVDYGMSIGFESTDLITALLLVQFIGFPAALIFGRLGEKWGVKKSIFLAIGIYMLATIGGMQMTQKIEFYMLAAVIGLVQGGVQALSRSYYSRLIPSNQAAEYFGFYNMLGKFAVILGPILMGTVALLARNWLMPEAPTDAEVQMVGQLAARWSIGSILILFLIGGALLYFVDEDKGREEARYLENKSF
jgi:UMF1 family MFS transporter